MKKKQDRIEEKELRDLQRKKPGAKTIEYQKMDDPTSMYAGPEDIKELKRNSKLATALLAKK